MTCSIRGCRSCPCARKSMTLHLARRSCSCGEARPTWTSWLPRSTRQAGHLPSPWRALGYSSTTRSPVCVVLEGGPASGTLGAGYQDVPSRHHGEPDGSVGPHARHDGLACTREGARCSQASEMQGWAPRRACWPAFSALTCTLRREQAEVLAGLAEAGVASRRCRPSTLHVAAEAACFGSNARRSLLHACCCGCQGAVLHQQRRAPGAAAAREARGLPLLPAAAASLRCPRSWHASAEPFHRPPAGGRGTPSRKA